MPNNIVPHPDGWLNVATVAMRLDISRGQIRRNFLKPPLRCMFDGHQWWYDPESVEAARRTRYAPVPRGWISTQNAAVVMGVDYKTVYNLRKSGVLKNWRVIKRHAWHDPDEIRAYAKRRTPPDGYISRDEAMTILRTKNRRTMRKHAILGRLHPYVIQGVGTWYDPAEVEKLRTAVYPYKRWKPLWDDPNIRFLWAEERRKYVERWREKNREAS